ncbi:MAG TPA: type 4a pilus biogenesis protein PilO [Actinomycetota bacterium]
MGSRRAPIFAAIGVAVVAILLLLFLVLPKMRDVSAANEDLVAAENETETLEGRLRGLEETQANAPEYQATIDAAAVQVPPTADESGLLLQLQGAATQAGLDVLSLTPGVPTFDDQRGLSVIVVNVNGEGIYFDVADFLYNIETLPRAAVVTSVALAPGETDVTGVPRLTVTATVELYTTDTSAGPGSVPGTTTGNPPDGGAG